MVRTRSQAARAAKPHDSTHDANSETLPHEAVIRTVEIDAESTDSFDTVPPIYTIDLSLPPEQRYVQVAKDYKLVIEGLTHIFDDLLESVKLPKKLFHFVARLILRKLHSKEQTAELAGISKVTEVPMYLLVAYNVLLDLFMGCTSGGIPVKERGKRESKIMHFRTLDWGMPQLKEAIAQFEFKEKPDGEVVARTINYVGFVGVVTGVTKGLSLSLNFRPYHNDDRSTWSNCKFYGHILMVLLGLRPCIAAHLRDVMLPPSRAPRTKNRKRKNREDDTPGYALTDMTREIPPVPSHILANIARDFPSIPTTAAYLTFCSGAQTIVLEKDRVTANIVCSDTFVTVTNHDVSYESLSTNAQAAHAAHAKTHHFGIGMKELVDESMDRKGCMVAKWEKRCRRLRQRGRGGPKGDQEGVELQELKRWLLDYPVTNGETHFVTIMDPAEGVFRWVRSFEKSLFEESDEGGE
ncbi:hypothetical protein BU26DRAFT_521427 [Trematosphaeria pertusa]|uniref:ceramidase n=1 Tax=Trematosphaeria pertusa TaxID=390896 RepID=A0A6A6I6D9_9PLEO|nr:uncharacterized protein BU26DRAFT_521427 [Trematosphaeria pertusa]KAF2245886.1 hypothetical protein BU26DRAFT_521427 [Trematosphaeria pertusa]